jgi:Response regulator containing a CheY-like receiver domain and an HTH DNA-binding domain
MIRILLVDEQQMFLDGIRALLEKYSDIEVVGTANNGEQALKILNIMTVDVVVMDINMSGMNGIEATKLIREKYEKTKVLILSMSKKKEFIIKLIEHGATGYILKNKGKEELLMAIQNVAVGKSHYGLEVLDHAVSVSNIDRGSEVVLTEREREVLILIAEGYSSREISSSLYISEATVNTHRRNIMAKLGLPSATHMVRYAIKHGYVKL